MAICINLTNISVDESCLQNGSIITAVAYAKDDNGNTTTTQNFTLTYTAGEWGMLPLNLDTTLLINGASVFNENNYTLFLKITDCKGVSGSWQTYEKIPFANLQVEASTNCANNITTFKIDISNLQGDAILAGENILVKLSSFVGFSAGNVSALTSTNGSALLNSDIISVNLNADFAVGDIITLTFEVANIGCSNALQVNVLAYAELYGDPNQNNNIAVAIYEPPAVVDLQVSAPSPSCDGENTNFTLTITNLGSDTIMAGDVVNIEIASLAGFSFADIFNVITTNGMANLSAPNIAVALTTNLVSGAGFTLTFSVKNTNCSADLSFTATATAVGNYTDPNATNNNANLNFQKHRVLFSFLNSSLTVATKVINANFATNSGGQHTVGDTYNLVVQAHNAGVWTTINTQSSASGTFAAITTLPNTLYRYQVTNLATGVGGATGTLKDERLFATNAAGGVAWQSDQVASVTSTNGGNINLDFGSNSTLATDLTGTPNYLDFGNGTNNTFLPPPLPAGALQSASTLYNLGSYTYKQYHTLSSLPLNAKDYTAGGLSTSAEFIAFVQCVTP